MKPGFDFDRTEEAWRHGMDFWHHGVFPWFQISSWGATLGLGLVGVVYFVPSLTAFVRRHPNRVAILLLNALLGWTFFGWAVALVWSATVIRKTGSSQTMRQ